MEQKANVDVIRIHRQLTVLLPKLKTIEQYKEDGGNAGNILIDFYVALGWNKEMYLEPTKVKLNKTDWHMLCDIMMALHPGDEAQAGVLMLCNGPSEDAAVRQGSVKLLAGWVHE